MTMGLFEGVTISHRFKEKMVERGRAGETDREKGREKENGFQKMSRASDKGLQILQV